jgi:hypothetical protein
MKCEGQQRDVVGQGALNRQPREYQTKITFERYTIVSEADLRSASEKVTIFEGNRQRMSNRFRCDVQEVLSLGLS